MKLLISALVELMTHTPLGANTLHPFVLTPGKDWEKYNDWRIQPNTGQTILLKDEWYESELQSFNHSPCLLCIKQSSVIGAS